MTFRDLPPPPARLLDDAALFLDFDGTLVELADRPDLVRVDDRLARLIARLRERLGGRIAIVSGRPAGEIAVLLGNPGFAIAGSHGMEVHHADGRRDIAERPAALPAITAAMRAFAARDVALLIEEKPLGSALHFRAVPHYEMAAIALARSLADTHGLRYQPGKMMVEVRSPAADKGAAIRALMQEPAMATARPVFLGDDDTDEPAFAAVTQLGGHGILIGEVRDTSATHRLPTVAATLDWLEAEARA